MGKEEIIEKFREDLRIIIDLYGDPAVEHALKDAYGEIAQPLAVVEAKSGFLNENALAWGNKILNWFSGAGRTAGRSAAGGVRGLAGKALDQDIWISGQDDPLEVKSDAMADLLKQTNELVQKTNELLGELGIAIDLSNKSLGEVEFSVDDAVSAITGKSVADVQSRQASRRKPETKETPEVPLEIEEPLEPEEGSIRA